MPLSDSESFSIVQLFRWTRTREFYKLCATVTGIGSKNLNHIMFLKAAVPLAVPVRTQAGMHNEYY